MAYKNDSVQTIMGRYGKASDATQTEMYETWDAIRHLAVSGNALGGSGLGAFSSFLMNIARLFGSPAFSPILGSQAISVPGTQYYAPFSGGTGIIPGGQSSFGLAPWAQSTMFPSTGGAAPVSGLNSLGDLGLFSEMGAGSGFFDFNGVGDYSFPSGGLIGGAAANIDGISNYGSSYGSTMGNVAGGQVVGAALGDAFGGIGALGTVASTGAGMASGLGLGRNWLMPAASALSGIGGLLTTLGPLFGPVGLAGVAAGGIINGAAGAILSGFQQTNQRVLANADTVHEEKLRNLDVTKKMLGAQSEILKKMLKEEYDGDKKALENL